jgi:hypothetical protein
LTRLYRIKDEAGPHAWRGRAVELAIDGIVLDGISDEEAIGIANSELNFS